MKANVMDTIQGKLPSQEKQMSPVDILRRAFPESETGLKEDAMLNIIGARLENPKRSVVQIGNTVFLTYRVSPTEVEFHMATSEPARQIIKNASGFGKFLRNQGVKVAKTIAEKPEIVKLATQVAKDIGATVKSGQSMKRLNDKIRPVYTLEINL